MGVFKLCEVMNTRYLCDWHTQELFKVLTQHEGDTIDLAKCYFTPLAVRIIDKFYRTIDFINSENAELNGILQHNKKVRAVIDSKIYSRPIPSKFSGISEIAEFISTLEDGVILNMTQTVHNPTIIYHIASIIQIVKPQIYIDLGSDAAAYFENVRTYWLSRARAATAYWEVKGTAIIVKKVEKKKVFDDIRGFITEEEYRSKNIVLPYKFGTQILTKDKEFGGLIERSFGLLKDLLRPKPTLRSYIQIN